MFTVLPEMELPEKIRLPTLCTTIRFAKKHEGCVKIRKNEWLEYVWKGGSRDLCRASLRRIISAHKYDSI